MSATDKLSAIKRAFGYISFEDGFKFHISVIDIIFLYLTFNGHEVINALYNFLP